MADFAAPADRSRSIWGTLALVLTAISILGFILLALGDALNWQGFSEEDESTTGGDESWIGFSLGAILALITGVVAFLRGRRRQGSADTRAGQIAIGWFVVAVVLTAIFASVT